jgi:transcriptional regulator with XRE-family HTH domain
MIENKTVDYAAIGRRVFDVRMRKGLSQKGLAERAGITSVFLSNIENAHNRASLATFLKLANGLGVSADALLCDNLDENRDIFEEHLGALLADCTEAELKIITGTVKGLKEQIRAIRTTSSG